MSTGWETAFVAVSVIVGEPVDAVARALGPAAGDAGAPVSELLRKLAGASREARARALARVVSEVALAVDAVRLA